jgi:hypothetical protein
MKIKREREREREGRGEHESPKRAPSTKFKVGQIWLREPANILN